MNFDSSPELAFYIWLKDNQIEFMYHSGFFFEYVFDGAVCRYYPDFYINDLDVWIELKGDQFFKEDGTMYCPFKKKGISEKQQNVKNQKYEAKHQCMIKNGVYILRNADYQFALDYISQTYGKDYLQKFRKKKKQSNVQEGNL